MDSKTAVLVYAQSEKIKAGLIWVSQIADQVAAMDVGERHNSLTLLKTLARLVAGEAGLAARVSNDTSWHEIGKSIEKALVMIESGVPQETGFHLTQALTRVTRIGGRAARVLEQKGVFTY